MNEPKVYHMVIEYIKTLVQTGALPFGGKLPSERQLMATLGLSRNSIREALRSLENMGIIESRHGQGNFLVNHIDQSMGSIFSLLLLTNECSEAEIHQLRRSIEIGAYLIAVKRVTDTELQKLRSTLDFLKNSPIEQRDDFDKQFHDLLINTSGNRLLILLNTTLSQLFARTIREKLTQISSEEWESLLVYHTQIYECLAAHDETAGIIAIMKHYELIEEKSL